MAWDLAISTLAVYFPDVAEMYQIVLTAWMYLTPIIIPETIIPAKYPVDLTSQPHVLSGETMAPALIRWKVARLGRNLAGGCHFDWDACWWDGIFLPQNLMNLPTVSETINKLAALDQLAQTQAVVHLEDVSVRYRVPTDRIGTFKEYMIRTLKRQVQMRTFWAVNDVSINVQKGEVFGFIGDNGAGKSTLLKVVARVLRPTKGRVIVRGKVAPLLELGAGFHPELTGKENIFLNGALLGYSHGEMQEKYQQIVDFSELGGFIDAPIRTYSTGMYARLGFSVATAHEPDILIVDEILGVGDESFQQKCADRIAQFRQNGTSILLVSHSMELIEKMCQRAAWLDHGKLMVMGEPAQVIQAYREKSRLRLWNFEPYNHSGFDCHFSPKYLVMNVDSSWKPFGRMILPPPGLPDHLFRTIIPVPSQGILRGLHYQIRQAQGKVVRAIAGEIFDVAVDLRRNSPTFGRWEGVRAFRQKQETIMGSAGFRTWFLCLQ